MHKRARITVLKTLIDDTPGATVGPRDDLRLLDRRPCGLFREGDEFIVEDSAPEGFCRWAWADIHGDLLAVLEASAPRCATSHVRESRCGDGRHPVIFRIEPMEAC